MPQEVNVLDSVVETVDDVLDDVAGVRPLGAVKKIAKTVAPANVVEDLTRVPKPDKVLSGVQDRIQADVKSKRPPTPPSLPPMF